MSDNYQKVAKLFNLNQSNGTVAIAIEGASFIHGMYSQHTGPVVITLDENYSFYLGSYESLIFTNPIAFSTIRINSNAGHAAVIAYS